MGQNGTANGAVGRAPDGRWLPGVVPNPSGRPVGARARYADKFLSDAFASWKEHGTAALEKLREEDNKAYCQLMAGLLPKNLVLDATAEPGPLDGMTPEELQRLLELVRLAKAKTIDNCET